MRADRNKVVLESSQAHPAQNNYGWVDNLPESDFLQFLTVKQGLEKTSIKHARLRFNHLKKFLQENNTSLNKQSIESFFFHLRERGLTNNSLNTYIFMVKQLDLYAKDRQLDFYGFTEGLKSFEKTRPMIEILSVDEIEAILKTNLEYGLYHMRDTSRLNVVYKVMCRFLATTGCRYDECASLKIKDLNLGLQRATFTDTKNKQPRFAYLSEPLISELKGMVDGRKPEEYVFTSMKGNKVVPQSFIDDLKHRAIRAGITKRVHPHLFRHSFATQLLMSGVEITRVASILGHKDIQTTFQNYVHLADDTIRKATYHHPLIRKSIDPREILKMVRDSIQSLGIASDFRFAYTFNESESGINISVQIKS